MAVKEVYVAGGNGIGYTYVVDSPSDYSAVPTASYFKDKSLGVGGLIMYKNEDGGVLGIFDEPVSIVGNKDNGVVTLNGSWPNYSVEDNMTFDGSILSVSGSVAVSASSSVALSVTQSGSGLAFSVSGRVSASSSTSEDLFVISQSGQGRALVVEDSLFVDSNGRVGIGATAPSYMLSIGSVGRGGGMAIYGTSSGHVHIKTRDSFDSWTASLPVNKGHIPDYVYNNFGGELMLNDGQGNLYFGTTPSLYLPENYFWIGNTHSYAYPRLLSGDIYSDYTGSITIGTGKVSYSKIQQVSQKALLGSSNPMGGPVEEIPIIDSFIDIATASVYLGSASSWSKTQYVGSSITDTFQGQFHVSDSFLYTAVDDNLWVRMPRGYFEVVHRDCVPGNSTFSIGSSLYSFRMPYAMEISEVRASLSVSGSGGSVTSIDIKCAGVSIFSTLLTIDSGEKTSKTAATPAVLSTTILPDDSEISVDINGMSINGGEAGLKIAIIGWRYI
jgi:hypothetical protein